MNKESRKQGMELILHEETEGAEEGHYRFEIGKSGRRTGIANPGTRGPTRCVRGESFASPRMKNGIELYILIGSFLYGLTG